LRVRYPSPDQWSAPSSLRERNRMAREQPPHRQRYAVEVDNGCRPDAPQERRLGGLLAWEGNMTETEHPNSAALTAWKRIRAENRRSDRRFAKEDPGVSRRLGSSRSCPTAV